MRIDKKAMEQFHRKHSVNLVGVVPISFDVMLHHCFDHILLPVRTGESARIEQDFADVTGKSVPVPDAEMVILVTAKEETLQMKGGECMIHLRYPLGHAVVICPFRLESKCVQAA